MRNPDTTNFFDILKVSVQAMKSHASRGRGAGFAGPGAQRPLWEQSNTRSDKRGG